MGTGVGEAALIGAAVGGGTALLTGNDPLRGALLGGVTGGAGGAMFGGASGGAGATGATTGAATGTGAAVNSFSQSLNPLTSVGTSGTNALSNTLQAAQVAPTAINQGIAGAIPNSGLTAGMGPGGIPEIGMNLNKAVTDTGLLGNFGGYDNLAFNRAMAPQFTSSVTQAVPQTVSEGLNAGVRNLGNSAYDVSGQVVNPAGVGSAVDNFTGQLTTNFGTSPQAVASAAQETIQKAPPPDPGFFTNMLDKYKKLGPAGQIGVGIAGGVGLNALAGGFKQPGIETKEEEENPFGLATYDRKKYTAINPMQHNVYRPTYAAEGGEMHSYAQGGIAALAAGGMGGNTGYPMGQMDMTQYATPTQMPTSAQVVNADYEQKTDPYSGSPIGMANGGQVFYDPSQGQFYTRETNIFGSPGAISYIGAPAPQTPDAVDAYEAYVDQTATPNVYKTEYQKYIEGTPMVTTPEAFPSSPNFTDSYNLLAATAPNIASTISSQALGAATGSNSNMAQGGIAGYNLGGYASGGNPRLLKGPGDGMSDNIPATIGGRQPARLADGEFVVPADVVSHLGNGSTDAGAKHLYNMMDKVRKARTGTKKQGKQIKPGKFLPA